jgi:hypothetical protein
MDILLQNLDNFNKEMLENLQKNNKELWEGLENLGKTNDEIMLEMHRLMGELEEAPKPVILFLQNVVSKPFNPFAS